jgi:hypothetical protein
VTLVPFAAMRAEVESQSPRTMTEPGTTVLRSWIAPVPLMSPSTSRMSLSKDAVTLVSTSNSSRTVRNVWFTKLRTTLPPSVFRKRRL